MKVILLLTGKTTEKFLAEGISNYYARIKRYNPFEIITVPDLKNTRNMPVSEQKEKEGLRIIQLLRHNDYVIILEEKGEEYPTARFADLIEKTMSLSWKRVMFIIGGPWGLSDEVCLRADFRLSLSKMTFSHQMVRLVFLEQLYRAFTIIKGDPYHHE